MFFAPDDIDVALAVLSREFARTAAEHDRSGVFPFGNIARLRETGLHALVVPRAHGGKGQGLFAAHRAVNAVARGEASTGLVLAQQYLFHGAIAGNANFPAALREKIFRSAVESGAFANNLRVEPDLGTPLRGGVPATVARRVPGGWSLSGRKIFATGSPVLAWNAIWAGTDEPTPRIGPFLVPAGTPGLRIEETWRQLGMRASGSHDVILDNVFIPEDHAGDILPQAQRKPDAVQMAWLCVLFATVYDGVARAARDWLVHFLNTRKPSNLGAPLASLPRMQEAVGQIESALYASRVQLENIAARVDRGETPSPQESSYAKQNSNQLVLTAVSKALEVSGNPGLSQDNPLERHYRDALCARVHSPQGDTVWIAGGREALAGAL